MSVLPASNQQSPARRGAKTRDQSSAGQSFRLTNGGPFFGVFLAPVLRTKIMPLAAALATPGPARALQLTRCQRVTSATPSNNACLPEYGLLAPAAKVRDGHAEQALELRCSLSQSRFELTAQALQGQPQNLLLLAWFLRPAQALLATQTGFPRCVVLRVL